MSAKFIEVEHDDRSFRSGFIAACEWILDGKPNATDIRIKINNYKNQNKHANYTRTLQKLPAFSITL